MSESSQLPMVSIIAVCYNHAKFVVDCLDHIRAQTYTNAELIIMDDCSKDDSVSIIRNWIKIHEYNCTFIAHTENIGFCKTLNEALATAKGEYISIIATDDTWEPDKIERQMVVMRAQPEQVAVVYSDAAQMDESGRRLPKSLLTASNHGINLPSGRIFSTLVDINIIPAMATIIRRQAIEAVGGYDERLTYEDYDMWLRLAERYGFVFCPGIVANYRIVSTSITRTIFHNPTAKHSYSEFMLREKWWNSDLLSPAQRTHWAKIQLAAADSLYVHGDPRARLCLWKAYIRTRKPRALMLALACSLGISRSKAKKLQSLLRGSSG